MTRPQLTIFEGPDGVGKTTLAKAYAELTKAHYVHFGPFKGERAIAHYYAEAIAPVIHETHSVVMDRSWISERPYANALRDGDDRIGVLRSRQLDRLAATVGAVVVWPQLDGLELVRTFGSKPELATSTAQLQRIMAEYQKPGLTLLRSLAINREGTPVEMAKRVQELITAHNVPRVPRGLNAFGFYESGNVLLVGDRSSAPKTEDAKSVQWPFGSFSQAGCSRWLAAQLEEAGIYEHNLVWTNANDPHEGTGFNDLIRWFYPKIVALGAEAALRVAESYDAQHLPPGSYDQVHHPQAWKRFHPFEPYPLVQLPVFRF
ncbi:MAG: hypothetical protein PHU06_06235 [Gallionella sp.]|nr:hypothetical protein [Gallionella sp.]MDD4958436.1 hypothetical protein [Gallionella sp.]